MQETEASIIREQERTLMKKKVLKSNIIGLFVLLTVVGCGNAETDKKVWTNADKQGKTEAVIIEETMEEIIEDAVDVVSEEVEPEFEEYEIGLMAIGDNLMHMGVVNTGKMEDGSYDYSFLFYLLGYLLTNL